jgi:SpoVK/Ycf46/Vps4 family AAA+-type ATPase
VYLEQRAPQDLVRNGLVSVFLRTMEYCQGVMFLTTNRASLFDPAALSRIHLKLKYNDLNLHARHEIWENFLGRAKMSHGSADICDEELDRLIKTQLNGREVRLLARDHRDTADRDNRSRM